MLHVHVYVGGHEPPLREYPASHELQMLLLLVHADPVAGDPLLHVQVFSKHAVPDRWYPAAHTLQMLLLLVHSAPIAGNPSLQVQVCMSHTRYTRT